MMTLTNSWFIFGAGILVGVLAARFLLGHPTGRSVVKRAIKVGLGLGEWLATQMETLREDVSDLVAEAQAERRTGAAAGTH
jgi:hypothetical protein